MSVQTQDDSNVLSTDFDEFFCMDNCTGASKRYVLYTYSAIIFVCIHVSVK